MNSFWIRTLGVSTKSAKKKETWLPHIYKDWGVWHGISWQDLVRNEEALKPNRHLSLCKRFSDPSINYICVSLCGLEGKALWRMCYFIRLASFLYISTPFFPQYLIYLFTNRSRYAASYQDKKSFQSQIQPSLSCLPWGTKPWRSHRNIAFSSGIYRCHWFSLEVPVWRPWCLNLGATGLKILVGLMDFRRLFIGN